jgi:hypothetical protein
MQPLVSTVSWDSSQSQHEPTACLAAATIKSLFSILQVIAVEENEEMISHDWETVVKDFMKVTKLDHRATATAFELSSSFLGSA